MRLLPTVANDLAVVDVLTAAGFSAETMNFQSPDYHIAVIVDPGQEPVALAAAHRVDPDIQVLA